MSTGGGGVAKTADGLLLVSGACAGTPGASTAPAIIQTWRGCDAWEGSLDAIGLDGVLMRHLVPIVGDARGVVDSAGLATVCP